MIDNASRAKSEETNALPAELVSGMCEIVFQCCIARTVYENSLNFFLFSFQV